MPFGVRRQNCTDSAGKKGRYVVYRQDTGAKVSCHRTRSAAEAARRIRSQASGDMNIDPEDLKIFILDTLCTDPEIIGLLEIEDKFPKIV